MDGWIFDLFFRASTINLAHVQQQYNNICPPQILLANYAPLLCGVQYKTGPVQKNCRQNMFTCLYSYYSIVEAK